MFTSSATHLMRLDSTFLCIIRKHSSLASSKLTHGVTFEFLLISGLTSPAMHTVTMRFKSWEGERVLNLTFTSRHAHQTLKNILSPVARRNRDSKKRPKDQALVQPILAPRGGNGRSTTKRKLCELFFITFSCSNCFLPKHFLSLNSL